MTHTPGPWHVVKIPGESRLRVHAETYDVADICHAGGADDANARLIAAAPDMLAACKDFLEACHKGKDLKPAMAQARKAIEKAEGRDA